MFSRFLMTASAVLMGLAGIALTFAPELLAGLFDVSAEPAVLLIGQVLGALYFALAMLNWMLKDSVIGGIYNRPALVTNLSHFVIAGLALLRHVADGHAAGILWAVAAVYALFGIGFGVLLFRHPSQKTAAQ
ncbi:MAG TPA: hypothetical protein PLC52_00085 [Anaerolineales bacterium]|nr:hypothetical protein [Anaerolineales bacterium]HRQ91252.1 hypothetical protein [Anaerolineales bacterium]